MALRVPPRKGTVAPLKWKRLGHARTGRRRESYIALPPHPPLGTNARMPGDALLRNREKHAIAPVRTLADQAFSRAAGAPLIDGNSVRLLIDAQENYPAWLAAIQSAKRHIYFENYIITEDAVGRMFADALVAKAAEGVRV